MSTGATVEDAIALEIALSSGRIIAGDTLVLLDSVDRDSVYNINIDGTTEESITLQPNGNTAKFLNGLTLSGANVIARDIEILYNQFSSRDSEYSDGSDMPVLATLSISGENVEVNKCLIHDTAGIGFWKDAVNGKLIECLIWFNGWREPDNKSYGHAIYTQNVTGTKIIKNCIVFMNYCDGLKLSGTDDAGVFSNYLFENCIFFDNGNLSYGASFNGWIGGSGTDPYTNIILRGCEFYIRPDDSSWSFSIGYTSGLDNFEITNCFFEAFLPLYVYPAVPYTNFTINNNLFYSSYTERLYNTTEPAATLLADESNIWQEIPTSGKRIRLIICEVGVRGHLVIYNYDLDNTVDADCSALLAEGDSYRLTNVQDLFIDIITGTAGVGGSITIDMVNRTISTPEADTVPDSTFPRFGCFILEKVV